KRQCHTTLFQLRGDERNRHRNRGFDGDRNSGEHAKKRVALPQEQPMACVAYHMLSRTTIWSPGCSRTSSAGFFWMLFTSNSCERSPRMRRTAFSLAYGENPPQAAIALNR